VEGEKGIRSRGKNFGGVFPYSDSPKNMFQWEPLPYIYTSLDQKRQISVASIKGEHNPGQAEY
jgi:hypothetical protein